MLASNNNSAKFQRRHQRARSAKLRKMKSLTILICFATLCLLGAFAHAESLREGIAGRIEHKSALYDELVRAEANGDPIVDLFNSTEVQNMTTTAWQSLPSWLLYTGGIVIVFVSTIICFYGVRLLPMSIFLEGGFICAFFMYAILASAVPNSNPQKTGIVYGTSFAIWLVCGVFLALCINVAVFILGVSFGAYVGLSLNSTFLKHVWAAQPTANMIIWVIVFGIIGGIVACFLKKPLLVVATAGGGAFGIVYSIMAMSGTLNISGSNGDIMSTTWMDWTAFAGFLALTALGCVVQSCCTMRSGDLDFYTKMD